MNRRLLWLLNLIIVLIVLGSTVVYVRKDAAREEGQAQQEFVRTSDILTDIADDYMDSERAYLRSWKYFITNQNYTMEEAEKLLKKQITDKASAAHLIWEDELQGISSQEMASDPGNYTVNYQNLSSIFTNEGQEGIFMTPRYINPMNGEAVIAFYSDVILSDGEGNARSARLMHVISEKKIRQNLHFPTDYAGDVSVAIVKTDGSYILKPNTMKNESIFSYVYYYNQGVVDTEQLGQEFRSGGSGSFIARNAKGEDCIWVYNHMAGDLDRILVAVTPLHSLKIRGVDLVIPSIIFLAMVILLLLDIFIYIEFENKSRENEKNLKMALATAEQANRAKTTFLNNMSHDIRTPMNAIIGFTALAAKHLDNRDQVADYLSKISTSSKHLLALINDILDMSRIESGKVVLDMQKVYLPEIFHSLRTILQADMNARNLEFYIDALDVENENVWCDKLRLSQVLLNLLGNALKFTKPGGTISLRIIQKANAPEGYANYEFHVKDTGIGMSREFQQHIFEPFEREKTSTVSGIQGTGLGMAITHNIVSMMGGDIQMQSEEGKGTEFIVSLTLKVTEGEVQKKEIPHLKGLNALVADDDLNTCFSVCKMLEEIGMQAEWTTSGKEAVVRARYAVERGNSFAVYIIDWLMPDMNGIEVVRRIRMEIGNETPIIILTAYDWSDIEDEARAAGVTAFCEKPLFMSQLREILNYPEGNAEAEQEEEQYHFSGKRILLAEDNMSNQEIAMTILKEAGFQVDVVVNGKAAVEKMQQAPAGSYDMILMDLQMPEMNGYEATRQIRQMKNPAKAQVPIIAMTANAFAEDIQACLQAGMNAHVSKPIDRIQLLDMLDVYFNGNKTRVKVQAQKEEQGPMDLRRFYELAGGDYQDAHRRVGSDQNLRMLLDGFMEDDSYDRLYRAVESGQIREAFEGAHALKGVSGNFGFTELAEATSVLVEQLRPQKEAADPELFARVREAYEKVIRAWKGMKGNE